METRRSGRRAVIDIAMGLLRVCEWGVFFGGGYEDYSEEVGLKVLVWRSNVAVCGSAMFISCHSWVVPTLYRRGHERSLPLIMLYNLP